MLLVGGILSKTTFALGPPTATRDDAPGRGSYE